jgi:hypothetical protein
VGSYLKIPNTKRGSRVVQTIEHLPSKHEALRLNSSMTKKKKKKFSRKKPDLIKGIFKKEEDNKND